MSEIRHEHTLAELDLLDHATPEIVRSGQVSKALGEHMHEQHERDDLHAAWNGYGCPMTRDHVENMWLHYEAHYRAVVGRHADRR